MGKEKEDRTKLENQQKMSRDGDEHPRDPPKCVCLCARKTGKENQISNEGGGERNQIKVRIYAPD